MEVHVRGQGKKRYLIKPPPEPMLDEWEREGIPFFSHILNSLEQKVQDLVMHMSTLKETWKRL